MALARSVLAFWITLRALRFISSILDPVWGLFGSGRLAIGFGFEEWGLLSCCVGAGVLGFARWVGFVLLFWGISEVRRW